MSKMAELHADILGSDGDGEALQIALRLAHDAARPTKVYLLMDGNTVLHAYMDEQLALMEAHIMMSAADINAGMRDEPSNVDVYVKPMDIDYTPFDWLDSFAQTQGAVKLDSDAQLDLFDDMA